MTDFAKRMDPLRRTEADLAKKRGDAESELNQQAAVIANPDMVLDFAKDVGEFIRHSSAKERKQVLKKFIKTVWVYPGASRSYTASRSPGTWASPATPRRNRVLKRDDCEIKSRTETAKLPTPEHPEGPEPHDPGIQNQ